MTVAAKYCLKCGYENDEERGACLLCYAPLSATAAAEGQATVLPEGVAAPLSAEAMAIAIADAAGDTFAGTAGAELGADYATAGMDEAAVEDVVGFDEMEAPTEAPAAAVAAEPVPGQVTEAEEELAPEEELAAVEEPAEEEYVPPPPPPGAVDLEEEPLPPPAPEPVAEQEPDLAAAEAVPTEAFAEPPPPPGAVDLEEEPAEEMPEDRPASDWSLGDG